MDTIRICEARSKQSGQQCKNFATKGKRVCRIHGGKSTGPRTTKGRLCQKKTPLKHGTRSREAALERREVREMIRSSKVILSHVDA
jgi:hypothetical protein